MCFIHKVDYRIDIILQAGKIIFSKNPYCDAATKLLWCCMAVNHTWWHLQLPFKDKSEPMYSDYGAYYRFVQNTNYGICGGIYWYTTMEKFPICEHWEMVMVILYLQTNTTRECFSWLLLMTSYLHSLIHKLLPCRNDTRFYVDENKAS